MRLASVNIKGFADPDSWLAALKKAGYRTSVFPADISAPDELVRSFGRAAEKAGVLIAEVGAWSNVLGDSERGTRAEALARSKRALYVADECGARCAVNISGSRGQKWDGPDEKNYSAETYEMIVQSVREIIDEVKPKRSCYTLEPMPWMYPCDIETQASLIRDIDRPAFAVHFDPVNMIHSPALYFNNGGFMKEFIRQFGRLIKCVHAKDTLLAGGFTLHIQELRPGLGTLDYRTLLVELEKIDRDMPVLVEHLKTDEEYALGVNYIRDIASAVQVGV
jgi:sugar phosphate isomerase/epimerase